MGLNFRKSLKAGPIKMNVSGSGVGFSTGVKGGRIGVSSKGGVYASGGANGVYFRKTINGKNQTNEAGFEVESVDTSHVKQEDVDRLANFIVVFLLVVLFLIGGLWHPLRWFAGGIAVLWIGFKVKKWLFG